MIELSKWETTGWEHAIRGARNPMNSWGRMDSEIKLAVNPLGNPVTTVKIGPNDYKLMMKLAKAGSDHGKYLRMINVYVDIKAPLYWWKEFDTYKVGTVANSCSTMHKIHDKPFELSDFSIEHLWDKGIRVFRDYINVMNECREVYLETKNKVFWHHLIQMLPTSYNQLRTVELNYEVLKNIYHARKNHKLDEWKFFCEWIEKLPYSELITGKTLDRTCEKCGAC